MGIKKKKRMFNLRKLYKVLQIVELGCEILKKMLITGGSGLVGNYLIGFFLKKIQNIYNCSFRFRKKKT